MKRAFGKNTRQWQEFGPGSVHRALLRVLLMGLLFLANQAVAGYTFHMVGGECTDSNRAEVFYPNDIDGGVWGPGPTLCADQVAAEITFNNDYVPGTQFEYFDRSETTELSVQTFSFTDGAREAFTDFPLNHSGLAVRGVLPLETEPSVLEVLWNEGFFFRAGNDGTWTFGLEFGGRDGVCGLGSIEGPNPTGEFCSPTGTHYFSEGTYIGWHHVPEPPPAAMALAMALAAMASLRYRRR